MKLHRFRLALSLAALLLTACSARAEWIWVEGEAASTQSVTRHPGWYDQVPKAAFSGGDFLSHFDRAKPGEASYTFTATKAGDYTLWVRANPWESRLTYRLNGGSATPVDFKKAVQQFTLTGWDMRFLAWVDAGKVSLKQGANSITFRFDGSETNHGMLDCFVFVNEPFQPYGIAKPGEAAELVRRAAEDESDWTPYNPGADDFRPGSAIDLRGLNEKFAGENGRILVKNGRFVHEKTGKPERFWAVNGPPHDLKGDVLRDCANMMAKHGINLARIHGAVFNSKTGEVDGEKIARILEIVDALKAEGIYSHVSIYFPLWFNPQAGLPWLQGYDGNKHPFAALYFNEGFQAKYREWWRALFSARNPRTGKTLLEEPALLGVELVNEDSYFFWTFSEGNIPDPQLQILERQFGQWLTRKYGSLPKALEAWGGMGVPRDNAAGGRIGLRPLWNIFSEKKPRDRDTAAFLLESQRGFYKQSVSFLRSLGYRGLVTCSNWSTASPEVFGPLEKYSYTAGDFIDRHGYFGSRNGGLFSEWSIRDGHTYVDRSALRFESEEPGGKRQFNHPAMDVHYDGLPSMISETTWTRPNRYRTEAPLFLAAYGALQGSDSIVHFALDGPKFDVKPQFWMQPWTLGAPSQIGQFPAAALIYRKGLIAEGPVLADIRLKVGDLMNLKGTPLPQEASFDELRLKDVPPGTALEPGARIDPLIHFAGRTEVKFTATDESSRLSELRPLIDRQKQTVTSATRELNLDYGKGLLTINAASAQGVCGNLKSAGTVKLKDLTLESPLEVGSIIAVPLDGLPLRTSRRILLQVMSEEKNSGFKAIPQGGINLIQSIGSNPWLVRKPKGVVRLTRPDSAGLKVTALDGNGYPAANCGSAASLTLRPDTLYYVIAP